MTNYLIKFFNFQFYFSCFVCANIPTCYTIIEFSTFDRSSFVRMTLRTHDCIDTVSTALCAWNSFGRNSNFIISIIWFTACENELRWQIFAIYSIQTMDPDTDKLIIMINERRRKVRIQVGREMCAFVLVIIKIHRNNFASDKGRYEAPEVSISLSATRTKKIMRNRLNSH